MLDLTLYSVPALSLLFTSSLMYICYLKRSNSKVVRDSCRGDQLVEMVQKKIKKMSKKLKSIEGSLQDLSEQNCEIKMSLLGEETSGEKCLHEISECHELGQVSDEEKDFDVLEHNEAS